MATFEQLQDSWRSQPVGPQEDPAVMQARFTEKLAKQQRSVLRSNIGVTAGFLGASAVIVWVYRSFHEGRSLFFSGSIACMLALMAVYLWVLWRGTSFRKRLDVADPQYTSHYIAILTWRRATMTRYVLVYCLLLWAALMCYMYDVLADAPLSYQVGGPLATSLYIWGVYFISQRTKVKRKVRELDEMIADLKKTIQ